MTGSVSPAFFAASRTSCSSAEYALLLWTRPRRHLWGCQLTISKCPRRLRWWMLHGATNILETLGSTWTVHQEKQVDDGWAIGKKTSHCLGSAMVARVLDALIQWPVAWKCSVEERNGELHGDFAKVAGYFGLSDLQDARDAYARQPGVEVRDLRTGLSGAGRYSGDVAGRSEDRRSEVMNKEIRKPEKTTNAYQYS
jgi:hypothetical protein